MLEDILNDDQHLQSLAPCQSRWSEASWRRREHRIEELNRVKGGLSFSSHRRLIVESVDEVFVDLNSPELFINLRRRDR